jgi:ubiquinone/menaquinone biosynthesis C-methylase UbiE
MNGTKVSDSYNAWASQYDTNKNRTRDLEALALQQMLGHQPFNSVLEIGCGTGKNTAWLSSRCAQLTAVDFSDEMLLVAKEKVQAKNVRFISADITEEWNFGQEKYDLVTFSLVLEHIDDLEKIFRKISTVIKPEGLVYIGELHPFKQYHGTKARFETSEGTHEVTCYTHHISDFTEAALKKGFQIQKIQEFFDDDNRQGIPRILSLVFIKS